MGWTEAWGVTWRVARVVLMLEAGVLLDISRARVVAGQVRPVPAIIASIEIVMAMVLSEIETSCL